MKTKWKSRFLDSPKKILFQLNVIFAVGRRNYVNFIISSKLMESDGDEEK